MHICHSFIDTYPWEGFFRLFLDSAGWVYLLLVAAVAFATFLDNGHFSWGMALAFIFAVLIFAALQSLLAMEGAYMRSGQFLRYCHSDVINDKVRMILQPEQNRQIFYAQLLFNAVATTLAFWLPFLVVRRLRRKDRKS